MDPEARRQMWTVIEKVSASRSVVLVSHSMEEVEALCTRMGVMVSGRLQCLGSAQHLKSRFGGGYQIEIRCVPERVQECVALCQQICPQAAVEEVHGGYVRLGVERQAMDLAAMFDGLEGHKQQLQIAEYSVSQSSLEQVFLRFAAAQEEETGRSGDGIVMATPVSPDSVRKSNHLSDAVVVDAESVAEANHIRCPGAVTVAPARVVIPSCDVQDEADAERKENSDPDV